MYPAIIGLASELSFASTFYSFSCCDELSVKQSTSEGRIGCALIALAL